MKGTSCEECTYFEYDEEEESYGCQFYFDEDDIARASLYGDRYICPHFQYKYEYRIVRKQIYHLYIANREISSILSIYKIKDVYYHK